MNLVFADLAHDTLKPITWTRSVVDVEIGGSTLGRHALSRLPISPPVDVFVPAYLRDITRINGDLYRVNRRITSTIDRGTLVWNPAILPEDATDLQLDSLSPGEVLVIGDVVAALVPDTTVQTHEELLSLADSYTQKPLEIDTISIEFPWDLDQNNSRLLRAESEARTDDIPTLDPAVEVLGSETKLSLGSGVDIGPSVTIDTRGGPILIEDHVTIGANSRLEGPLYVGEQTQIGAGENAVVHGNTHIGDHARVGGEVENLIMHSFTNKYHYGFLGHSILGSWVNVGAGTTSSDLKNTYGDVVVDHTTEGGQHAGMKVGTTIGDHTKTGIQTSIHTGKQIGPCCSLIGRVTDDVPAFTWQSSSGTGGEKYDSDRAEVHCGRMIERREEHLPDGYARVQKELVRDLDSIMDRPGR